MIKNERRRNLRYETKMRAVLDLKGESISAIVTDIGKCCIGLISEKEISPGTHIRISIKHTKEFIFHGTIVWTKKIRATQKILFRMGVETRNVIALDEIAEIGFSERSDYLKSLLSEKRAVKSVLFVDDEEDVRKLFKEALEKYGYQVTIAVDGVEGMQLFRKQTADLIITDIFMPNKDGHQLILEIMEEFPDTKVFAITGKNTILGIDTELDIAKSLGALRVFAKPIKISELLEAIKELSV